MALIDVYVHCVWTTVSRRPLLPVDIDARLAAFIAKKVHALRCSLVAIGNADDHVHAAIRLDARTSLATLMQHVKGASSHEANARRWLPHALYWEDGYYAASVTPGLLDPLIAYVRNQRIHHAHR